MKAWIFIAILLAAMSGGAYYYYTSTQNRIQELVEDKTTLEANNKTLVTANETNLKAVDDLNLEYERIENDYRVLETAYQEIRAENNQLRERLGKHDIGALAAAKPGLVENIINNASGEALRCFELLSGSPLTEQERNAKNAREFNSECPFLWTDNPTP